MYEVNLLLKSKRVLFDKTSQETAEYLGLCKSAYTMKERGQRKFTTDEIEKLAVLFKLSPVEVVQIFLPNLFTQIEQ
jgi:transcriptional regulator with XRE-family HTH domain